MYRRITCQTFLIMTMAFGSVAAGVQMPQSINNDKDLKSAFKAARTPEEHERIATYLAAKADRLDPQAAGYEQAAAAYRNGPVVKNITAPNTAARYESLAKEFHEEAQANREQAASQRQITTTFASRTP